MNELRSGKWTPGLGESENETLFAIVEDTLGWCVGGRTGSFSFDGYELTEKLKEHMATFVTLKIDHRLRGCIGSLAPQAPLYRSVHDNAINASLKDYRFTPLQSGEMSRLDVHISILGPITKISGPADFNIGEHGIILEKGRSRAVYLPEVAQEQGWTKEQTLCSLSLKAGMDSDAWRQDAEFSVFSSVVLSRP